MLVVISLGCDSKSGGDYLDRRHSADAHGHADRNLAISYSGSEDGIDRKLFR
jgi:hypothetical protein